MGWYYDGSAARFVRYRVEYCRPRQRGYYSACDSFIDQDGRTRWRIVVVEEGGDVKPACSSREQRLPNIDAQLCLVSSREKGLDLFEGHSRMDVK